MSFLASISLSLSFHRMISSTANRHSASKRGTIPSSPSLSFVFVFVPLPPFLSVSTHFPPCEQSLEWRGQILGLGPRSPHPALSFSSCNPPQEQLPAAVVAGAGSLFPWSSCPPPPFPRIALSSPLVVRWQVLAVLVVVVPLSLVFWSSSRCRVPHRHHRLPVVSGRPVAVSLPVVSPSLCSVVVVPVVPSSSSCPGAPCVIRWRVLAMLVVVTPLCLVFWSSSSVAPTVHL